MLCFKMWAIYYLSVSEDTHGTMLRLLLGAVCSVGLGAGGG